MATILPMTTPHTAALQRFDALQLREVEDAQAIADYGARVAGFGRLDQMDPRTKLQWVARGAQFLRGCFFAWRVEATNRAAAAVEQTIADGDVGAVFVSLTLEQRRHLARVLATVAIGSYQATLSGDGVITPGAYLVLADACEQERA